MQYQLLYVNHEVLSVRKSHTCAIFDISHLGGLEIGVRNFTYALGLNNGAWYGLIFITMLQSLGDPEINNYVPSIVKDSVDKLVSSSKCLLC